MWNFWDKLRGKKEKTTNYDKHNTKNIIGKIVLINFLRTLVEVLKPLMIDSVLDVGCGEGYTLERLRKEKIGKKFEGIDNDDVAIELGNKLHPGINIKKGDIYELPYKSKSFDLVIATEVLEHLDDPKKAYKELIRVSKKYVLLSVPNEPFFTIQRMGRLQNLRHLGAHPEHIQHWTIKSFSGFVKIKGVKRVARKFPIPWTLIIVKKSKSK